MRYYLQDSQIMVDTQNGTQESYPIADCYDCDGEWAANAQLIVDALNAYQTVRKAA